MKFGLAALALAAGACGAEVPHADPAAPAASVPKRDEPSPRFVFVDVAESAGLASIAWCGRPEKPHLLESGGNGLALLDYDGDGRLDVFLTSGWRLDGDRVVEKPGSTLYRNRGDGTFEDVTASAGIADDAWGTGCAVGDFDGDGRPDVFVSNFGRSVLWHNEGGGRFAKAADGPVVDGWATGAVFFDADGDGDEDLYVATYIECTEDEVLHATPTLDWKGAKVMLGPFGLPGAADVFFRNDGGKFTRATEEAGLADTGRFFGFGVAACDLDADGDLDLYVANDSNPNYLYRNDGRGHFTETGLWCGAGLSATGLSQAGMGVAIGDYDLDGRPDVLVTNFAEDAVALYRNLGRGLFRDVNADAALREPTFAPLKWGAAFADFDLDGDEDLFIAAGHIYPQADTTPGTGTTYAQRNLLLENDAAVFRDVTSQAGPGLAVVKSSRGVAMGDVDDDGDVDLVVSNVDSTPTLLRNDSPRRGHRLTVDAPDAMRVTVEAGGKKQTRFFVAGGSYCSASDPRFHFGLGAATKAERVTITWRRGGEYVLTDVAADAKVHVAPPK